MSRVGLNPITIEEGIQVTVEGNIVTVTGDGKELKISFPEILTVDVNDNVVQVNRKDDEKYSKSIHGTIRMIISNAINGIKNGFEKKLELVGVGYRAKMEGTTLVMSLGLNHPVKFESPEGITIEVPEETKIVLKGYDKQKLGEVAAKIRATRKPEPYKGKGIRYEGEYVRRKSSKSGITA
ncbi:50S ribosomal protein L6 [candidate division WS6 bacterium RIFOXYC1_FULL_33_10]|uniref:Large ribosomal subunit protein uL6 n=1 Tax=candidate division WS6 bacterium RIFOXYC1_FULL_33_10 TaxID=1802606 RepID=A0A1F4UQA1_9BACT|nr:MAG: 50S ribosomal protein L6 [candidate division WS6 bacterium RIFOXYC1_FULL_33_10]